MTEFFQTVMGRHFYDGTMPRIAKALEALNEKLELSTKLQTGPMVVTDGEPKVYDDGGCELCLKCGLLVSYHNGTDCDGAKAASNENNDPGAYDNRSRPLEYTSCEDLDRMGELLKRATDAELVANFSDLSKQACGMAGALQQLLWCDGPDTEHDSDTLGEVANITRRYGFGPKKP